MLNFKKFSFKLQKISILNFSKSWNQTKFLILFSIGCTYFKVQRSRSRKLCYKLLWGDMLCFSMPLLKWLVARNLSIPQLVMWCSWTPWIPSRSRDPRPSPGRWSWPLTHSQHLRQLWCTSRCLTRVLLSPTTKESKSPSATGVTYVQWNNFVILTFSLISH